MENKMTLEELSSFLGSGRSFIRIKRECPACKAELVSFDDLACPENNKYYLKTRTTETCEGHAEIKNILTQTTSPMYFDNEWVLPIIKSKERLEQETRSIKNGEGINEGLRLRREEAKTEFSCGKCGQKIESLDKIKTKFIFPPKDKYIIGKTIEEIVKKEEIEDKVNNDEFLGQIKEVGEGYLLNKRWKDRDYSSFKVCKCGHEIILGEDDLKKIMYGQKTMKITCPKCKKIIK